MGPVETAADHLPAPDVPPIGVGDGPFSITPQYQKAAADLGRRRIALAGARLANLLNAALGH